MNVFGELRGVLEGPVSPGTWSDICALVERLDPTRYLNEVAPYLEGRLASWPDALRRVPVRWLLSSSLQETPWLTMCRTLRVYHETPKVLSPEDPLEGLVHLLQAPWLEHITSLELHNVIDARHGSLGAALFDNDLLRNVRHLVMSGLYGYSARLTTEDATGSLIGSSPLMEGVTELHIKNVLSAWPHHPSHELLAQWLSQPGLQNLEALHIQQRNSLREFSPMSLDFPRLHTLSYDMSGFSDTTEHHFPEDWSPQLRHLTLREGSNVISRWLPIITTRPLETLRMCGVDWAKDHAHVDILLDALGEGDHLRTLELQGISYVALNKLASCSGLENLEELCLDNVEFQHKQARSFFQHLNAPKLRHLKLHRANLNHKAMHGLERFAELETIHFCEKSKLEERGSAVLASNPGRWTSLSLDRTRLGGDGAEALMLASGLRHVHTLNLTGSRLGLRGIRALVSCEHLGALEALHLGTYHAGNELDAEALALLARWPGLRKLKLLSLGCARLSTDALLPLLQADMPMLEVLDLTLNNVGPEGVRALGENTSLHNLRALGLTKADIDHEAVEILTATSWPRLQTLAMHDNKLRAATCDLLLSWLDTLPQLEAFDAGSAFLQFLKRRPHAHPRYQVTTKISYRGLTDGIISQRYVHTTTKAP